MVKIRHFANKELKIYRKIECTTALASLTSHDQIGNTKFPKLWNS